MSEWFADRRLVIATCHRKEVVIAPLVEQALHVQCLLPKGLHTDSLGTFSGEVERVLDPLSAARTKCLLAMQETGATLAIASEGSFGPHPTLPFCYADHELLVLVDQQHHLEFVAQEISTDTNFNGAFVYTEAELLQFASHARFPSHALMLRANATDTLQLRKGITDYNQLLAHFQWLITNIGSAYAETDMRAMHNPTRLKVIAAATRSLIKKVQSQCPACQTPGFGITAVERGLPCSLCGLPTQAVLAQVYSCLRCDHQERVLYPNQLTTEDPMYCDFCNP